MIRLSVGLLAVPLFTFVLSACSPENSSQTAAPAPIPPQPQMVAPAAPVPQAASQAAPAAAEHLKESAAGLVWSVPPDWAVQARRPMRVATYATPPAQGGSEPGEVAVFYFGPQEGGSVDANVERWFNQFEQEDGRPTRDVAEHETIEVDGMRVTLVRTRGTYNAAAGPMAPRAELRPDYRLIGAIAEGPQGAVFFKFTGPDRAVLEQETAFLRLVESLRRN